MGKYWSKVKPVTASLGLTSADILIAQANLVKGAEPGGPFSSTESISKLGHMRDDGKFAIKDNFIPFLG
ncbi:MAG: hypothetical protein J7604_13325 [Sporocytophaga sp.]|uniref:hypothetical protein n=1 Tax=Sporocytophaga sp. TaxID=2231183 RepID=UPI001B073295|nr:hypothetical protein [Sporocytophaga sp.]MBO9701184.1 hypothetical protein [Sporocytophaga sp.]